MRHLRVASLFAWAVLFAACADNDAASPANTSADLVAADPGATSERAEPVDVVPEETAAVDRASGTPCGPSGLVCSPKQQCCSSDPLPPAPPRFFCARKGTPCSP
ncbi:MAG TPA: hypothetical protein VKE22_15045 [Haliangiales bacterium]|nr:hypothetical protein [Haliangiales bacterium]